MSGDQPVDRADLTRPSIEVAPRLLNKVLVVGPCRGRIVEVEAYGGAEDPASHAFRGLTPRVRTMFGPAGHLYVYRSYGIHWCANVVTGVEGRAEAVLLRALEPLSGLAVMRRRRGSDRPDRQLADGPGKLCQAMGIDGTMDGVDLLARPDEGAVTLVDDGTPPPASPAVGVRVGISVAADRPWRFAVPGHPGVLAGRGPLMAALVVAGNPVLAPSTSLEPTRSLLRRAAHPQRLDDGDNGSDGDDAAVAEVTAAARRILTLTDRHPDLAVRTCRPGHLTGSALVLSADGSQTLLLFHTKLRRWLQPGGHADGDTNLAAVALREATEETGIEGLAVDPDPIDVDVHQVTPPAEDPHLHLDVRFLVVAPHGARVRGNHESEALRWVDLDELGSFGVDRGLLRLARAGSRRWAMSHDPT